MPEENALERQKSQQTLAIALAILGLAGLALFFSTGEWLFLLGALALFGIAIGMVWKAKTKTEQELLSERRKLSDQLTAAEKRFLSREMTETAFARFKADKQKQLVALESQLALLEHANTLSQTEETGEVLRRDKHKLDELLKKKALLNQAFAITEKKYLNREISEEHYLEIQEKTNADLLETDSAINALKAEPQVQKAISELKKNVKTATPEQKHKKRKAMWQEGETQEIDQIANDLAEQTKETDETAK